MPNNDPTSIFLTGAAARTSDQTATQVDAPRAADTLPAPLAAAQAFGEYELLSEVARGGMGVVYRARQTTLDRVVALKMILAGRLANSDDVQRFRTEAAAAARLQHPNIVAVFEVGEVEEQHFFSMEFIEGTSLAQKLAAGPLPGRVAANYVRRIAKAVHYAHRQGILHRDLKPSNILLDHADEPHITDFGLAKRMGGGSEQTRTGAVLGTPSYMAPEQAQGKTRDLGPACDIYSLGAILYDLLTGRPPFKAETPLDTVMQVIEHTPVPPRLLNPRVDHDLETICLKCLEKNPALRYESAEALAEDLQRYYEGESISARSFNVLDRIVHALDRDHHAADFAAWSSMLLWMAFIIGVEHLVVYLLVYFEQPRPIIFVARFGQFALLGVLFYVNRGTRLLPTTAAERELWTIWLGYFFTYVFALLVTWTLFQLDVIDAGPNVPRHWKECMPYPFISLSAGLCFFVMGSNYWGRCYAFGAAFWVLAAILPLCLTLAPLLFGLLWFVCLVQVGLHLRKITPPPVEPFDSEAATVLFGNEK